MDNFPAIQPAKLFHPFFVSVTEINKNEKNQSLEISCKIFTDDLEATLSKNYKTKVDLSAESQHEKMNNYISDYMQKHLQLTVNNQKVMLTYIGFEQQQESVYSYFEVPSVSIVKSMNIDNSLLYDYTDKQINIIHVIAGNKRQSRKLNYPQTKAAFSF